jgi:hypothetical protein
MKMKTLVRLTTLSVLGVCSSTAAGTGTPDPDALQPGTGPLANYTILKTTDYGKSMTRNFPAETTARQVVRATVPDLAAFFGERPKLVGVYQDQKDKKSACVFFSENLSGQPVKGLSVIKVTDDATREWVVFCQADAPKGEAMKLLSLHKPSAQPAGDGGASAAGGDAGTGVTPPSGSATSANAATHNTGASHAVADGSSGSGNAQPIPPADIKLQTYSFPDGTGTVGLPDGWTCNSQTIGGAVVKGPADQIVAFDVAGQVDVPGGQALRMLRMGGGNPANALIAPYSSDPATALKNLIEAINRIQQAKGGPTTTVDEVVNQQPRQPGPGMTNGHEAVIELAVTRTANGESRKLHSIQIFAAYTFNGGQNTWNYYASQEMAPEETFKQDLPVMNAIFDSLKENAAAINAKGAAEQKQVNQILDQTRQMNANVDATINQMHRQEVQSERSFADVDEGIRGYRKVYDTQTGDEADVNLGDVNGVVNALNDADPGRYVQIPLRDEVGP